jgi:hypothetical protein
MMWIPERHASGLFKKVRRQAFKNGKLVGTIVELQSALKVKSSKLRNVRKLHAELNRKDTVIIRMGASLKDRLGD